MGYQVFSASERAAWAPPQRLGIVRWIESNITLPKGQSSEPGRYRFDRTPYWRGVAEAVEDRNTEEIIVLKSAQIGYSQFVRNVLAWWIDEEPGPTLFVMPNEESARECVDERIRPLVEANPAIFRHAPKDPDDFTKKFCRFDTMEVYMGWAGSAQALATRPCRYVIADEVDKYPSYSGKEAEPLALARERTATYRHRRKILAGSTPTLRTGQICRAVEGCEDVRTYHLPCPHCGKLQRLVIGQLKYGHKDVEDRVRRAAAIELEQSAWYECVHCRGEIREQHKNSMLAAGLWVSGQMVNGEWQPLPVPPRAKRVAFWISAMYSPWKSFSDVAAEFIRSIGNLSRMQNFKNSWCAEPFEEIAQTVKVGEIEKLRIGAPEPGIVPEWAEIVLATADVQQNGELCYYTVRAWGADYRSQLIDFGTVPGVAALQQVLDAVYPIEGADSQTQVSLLLIDAGYRPDLVYQFAATDVRIKPLIGARGVPKRPITVCVGNRELGIERRDVDTNYYKDVLHQRRASTGLWLVNNAITDDYVRHLAAEHKIFDKKSGRMVWVPVSSGAANHYLDCEVYQQAGADMAGIGLIEDPDPAGDGTQAPDDNRIAFLS